MTTEASIFERRDPIPVEFAEAAARMGWPDGLLERAWELRVHPADLKWWLTHDDVSPEHVRKALQRRDALMHGTLRVREATWADDIGLADLFANSSEEIGDWEVIVERSPFPFAQFRLQEHVNIQVVEDRGVLFAVLAHSARNTIVAGQRTTVHIASAMRTRNGFRGMGYSRMVLDAGGPANSWWGQCDYYYVRSRNFDAVGWLKAINMDMSAAPDREGDVPGFPVTVHVLAAQQDETPARGIRRVRPSEVAKCLALINRTHKGQDLFRPYTAEFLRGRLDDPSWGPRPEFWVPVYGWLDYWVLEERGRVVACAGLWDRGRHIREVWHKPSTGDRQTLASTALMDWGFAEGHEEAMARLIAFFLGETARLGRDHLLAPVEHHPQLLELLAQYDPAPDTRGMNWRVFDGKGGSLRDPRPSRIYTDLAYW